jgi:hypothetical protein
MKQYIKSSLLILLSFLTLNSYSQSNFYLSLKTGASVSLGTFASNSYNTNQTANGNYKQPGYAKTGFDLNLSGVKILKNNILLFAQLSTTANSYDNDYITNILLNNLPPTFDIEYSIDLSDYFIRNKNFIIGSGYHFRKNKFHLDSKIGIGLLSINYGKYEFRAYEKDLFFGPSYTGPGYNYKTEYNTPLCGIFMLGANARYDLFKRFGIIGSIDFQHSIGAISDKTTTIKFRDNTTTVNESVKHPVSVLNLNIGLYINIGKLN